MNSTNSEGVFDAHVPSVPALLRQTCQPNSSRCLRQSRQFEPHRFLYSSPRPAETWHSCHSRQSHLQTRNALTRVDPRPSLVAPGLLRRVQRFFSGDGRPGAPRTPVLQHPGPEPPLAGRTASRGPAGEDSARRRQRQAMARQSSDVEILHAIRSLHIYRILRGRGRDRQAIGLP